MGTTYDFAVVSVKGTDYSAWVFTEATAAAAEVHLCPITGLPLTADGYKSVGDAVSSDDISFTLNSVSYPARSGINIPPRTDRRFVKVCGSLNNLTDERFYFFVGTNENMDSDTGIGLRGYASDIEPITSTSDWIWQPAIEPGITNGCALWEIPNTATTAIYAVQVGDYSRVPFLYRIDVPSN